MEVEESRREIYESEPLAVSQKGASYRGRSGNPRQGAWETHQGRRPFRGAASRHCFPY